MEKYQRGQGIENVDIKRAGSPGAVAVQIAHVDSNQKSTCCGHEAQQPLRVPLPLIINGREALRGDKTATSEGATTLTIGPGGAAAGTVPEAGESPQYLVSYLCIPIPYCIWVVSQRLDGITFSEVLRTRGAAKRAMVGRVCHEARRVGSQARKTHGVTTRGSYVPLVGFGFFEADWAFRPGFGSCPDELFTELTFWSADQIKKLEVFGARRASCPSFPVV